jgi:hypothetical protein
MNFSEVDIDNITFIDPENHEDGNEYICKIKYGEQDAGVLNVIVNSQTVHSTHDNATVNLIIHDNSVLQKFKKIQDKAIDVIFSNASEWFEDEIKYEEIKDNFETSITPNLESNSIEYHCQYDEAMDMSTLESTPNMSSFTIEIKGILFDGNRFKLLVVMKSYSLAQSQEQEGRMVPETSSDSVDVHDINKEEETSGSVEKMSNDVSDSPDEVDATDSLDEGLIEVEINESEIKDDDSVNMKFEKDNLFMIYDILNEKIRSNLLYTIQDIFDRKNIRINDFDMEDILFEDDDDSAIGESDSDEEN